MSKKISNLEDLTSKGLLNPPPFLVGAVQYETICGSMSYGVSSDASDVDLMGFCIPPKEVVFPHLGGHIMGFGTHPPAFEQFSKHHVKSLDGSKEYDFTNYNIVKYFQLLMGNNPNIVDSIYTPDRCVTFVTDIGKLVRSNRDIFLHKGSWHTFKGYAFSQMHKMKSGANKANPKRAESIEKLLEKINPKDLAFIAEERTRRGL